jgi:alkanesulfonate monooxygenase SsuD/methylene tetrahydromethanopterin reductase-like flavin-dependent oxidoreductase (luciferase family)
MESVGVILPQYHFDSVDELTDFATTVASLGYDSLWMGESWGRNSVSVLSFLAAETSTVDLGTAILNVYSRTPTGIAMAVASIDELSSGRFKLGIGPSNEKLVEDWHGVSFDRPLTREAAVIRILERVLSGETVQYDGPLYSLDDFGLRAPIERHHVPTYVAALGPKNRQLTGELADGWMPHNIPFPSIQEAFEEVASGASRAGRDPSDIEVAPYVPTAIDENVECARRRTAEHVAYYLGTSDLYNAAPTQFGFADESRVISERWAEGDRDGATDAVTDEMVKAMGIATTPSAATEHLADLRSQGVDYPLLKFPDLLEKGAIYTALEALAPQG